MNCLDTTHFQGGTCVHLDQFLINLELLSFVIPVFHRHARARFLHLTFDKIVFQKQLFHDIRTDRRAEFPQCRRDRGERAVGPLDLVSHRITSGVVLDNLSKVLFQVRHAIKTAFAPPPFLRTRSDAASTGSRAISSRPCWIVELWQPTIRDTYSMPLCPSFSASNAAKRRRSFSERES